VVINTSTDTFCCLSTPTSKVNSKTALAQHAYLLFYIKIVPTPLSRAVGQPEPPPLKLKAIANTACNPALSSNSTITAATGVNGSATNGKTTPNLAPPSITSAMMGPRRLVNHGFEGQRWGSVFATLDEQDRKEKDHAADLKATKGDTAWMQPKVSLAAREFGVCITSFLTVTY